MNTQTQNQTLSEPVHSAVAQLDVEAFFDPDTYTFSYVVADPASREAAIIDPVLDFDPASGKVATHSADRLAEYVRGHGLSVQWILETHVHADHLSGARYLKTLVGGQTGISCQVKAVQGVFGELFNAGPEFATDGSQFDHLLEDEETISIGSVQGKVWQTPGHTPACATFVFEGAAFVGDTLFMPDFGTARTDFPGGDASTLFASIRRILSLPEDTRLYLCHDYLTDTRKEYSHQTTVRAEREQNIHVADGVSEAQFVEFRQSRDKVLAAPRLLLPSVQFNMRGAAFAPPEDNGMQYLKIPVRTVEAT